MALEEMIHTYFVKNVSKVYQTEYTPRSFGELYMNIGLGLALHKLYNDYNYPNEINMHLLASIPIFWKYKKLVVVDIVPRTSKDDSPVYSTNRSISPLSTIDAFHSGLCYVGNLHTHPPNCVGFSEDDYKSFSILEKECMVPVILPTEDEGTLVSVLSTIIPPQITWVQIPPTHKAYLVEIFWGVVIPSPQKDNLEDLVVYYNINRKALRELGLPIPRGKDIRIHWIDHKANEYTKYYLEKLLKVIR